MQLPVDNKLDYTPVTSAFERKMVELMFKLLTRNTPITLQFDDTETVNLGPGTPCISIAPLRLKHLFIALTNPRFWACEFYTRGYWYCSAGDIKDLIILWQEELDGHLSKYKIFHEIVDRIRFYFKQYVTPTKSTRETKKHYNVSPEFYAPILGKTMAYSCAFFNEEKSESLDQAQLNKFKTTLERLSIGNSTNMKVLDIGSGWGSFVFYLLNNTSATVDGITIAANQVEHSNNVKNNLDEESRKRVNFFHQDYINYRKGEDSIYDRIVSIGMIEHVGKTQLDVFFKEVSRLLKPGGKILIHSIVSHEGGVPNMWIDKYIFPGGYLPKISEVINGSEQAGLLCNAVHRHSGENYVNTLECWRKNLVDNYDVCANHIREQLALSVKQVSKSCDQVKLEKKLRKTMRIWYFYLSSLQSLFMRSKNNSSVCQFMLSKKSM